MGVEIPLSRATISEGPHNMEDRFTLYKDLQLKHLKIFVPEAADIVLMKTSRFFGKDRDDIQYLIQFSRISESVLLKRFTTEMGDPRIIKSHYLLAIEESYGSAVADRHAKEISKKA